MDIEYLKANKERLMAEKKAAIKYADAMEYVPLVLPSHQADFAAKGEIDKSRDTGDTLYRVLAVNTTNWMDSHMDVHIPGLWKKTLKDNPTAYLLESHLRAFDNVISDRAVPSVRKMNWTDLGVSVPGQTQVLLFNVEIHADRNPRMFKQYANGWVKQHSVGMRYVSLALAINDDREYYAEEKATWDKYYPDIANKEAADEMGAFWAVTEAKLIEGSAVLFGSNPVTPTLPGKMEPGVTTGDPGEPTTTPAELDKSREPALLGSDEVMEIIRKSLLNK